jgi:hypothetical protein
MPSFLACYDYGQGGIWLYVEGESSEQIESAYPSLTIFEIAPPFWNDELETLAREHNPATNPVWAEWLERLKISN